MASRRPTLSLDHPVVKLFVIIAVVTSLYLAAEFLQPLALAVLIAFALAPLTRFLERWGAPRVLAVLLSVTLALGLVGSIGYVVFQQVNTLAGDLPKYRENVLSKVRGLQPGGANNLGKAAALAQDAVEVLDKPKTDRDAVDVRVVEQPSIQTRLETAVGPYLEMFGVATFVLILVTFMLLSREDLGDRIVALVGHRQVTLTTRTLDDLATRMSRYLAMFAVVNSSFGLVVGLGLWALQVPYAVLWGVMSGLLRFIPYVGPAVAFALPLIFSFAESSGLWQPLSVIGLFLAIEVVMNTLEPVLYGRTTGVSALGLLVAALFWTWLWGLVGLLIATPVTVSLAVLGKYVPSLGFFATLLGEDADLDPDVRFYQRLLAFDEDGATELVEAALQARSRVEVYDAMLIPALGRAERDFGRDEIDESEQAFIWRVIGGILDDQEAAAAGEPAPTDLPVPPPEALAGMPVLGVAANDHGDALVLRMLGQLLAPSGCPLEALTNASTPLAVTEAVAERSPRLVLLSHLPPAGLTPVRYLTRRLRARDATLGLMVGRWGERGNTAEAAQKLSDAGATAVVFSLAEARQRVLQQLTPATPPSPAVGVPQPVGSA